MLDILEKVSEWVAEGSPVALATVMRTWGSSPRREGAKMAVSTNSRLVGSVSGGCVEGAVVEAAQEVLAGGTARCLHFGVSDDSAWSVGLSCGGALDVWLELLYPDRWRAMEEAYQNDRNTTFVSTVNADRAGASLVLEMERIVWSLAEHPEDVMDLLDATRELVKTAPSGIVSLGDTEIFIDHERARPKLIIVGGAHVARALSQMAILLGYRVILVDPRRVFASKERFPELTEIHHDYPDRVFPQIGLDSRTSVVVLTHDPKIDDPALIAALPSPAPYVGVLSSKKTHRTRLKRLREAGVEEELLRNIRVPIGLDLGGRLPEEIALAILAEITAVRYSAPSVLKANAGLK